MDVAKTVTFVGWVEAEAYHVLSQLVGASNMARFTKKAHDPNEIEKTLNDNRTLLENAGVGNIFKFDVATNNEDIVFYLYVGEQHYNDTHDGEISILEMPFKFVEYVKKFARENRMKSFPHPHLYNICTPPAKKCAEEGSHN